MTAVAARAGISQAYVFKLFPTKEQLFIAAVERCYEKIEATFRASAATAGSEEPETVLDAIGLGYARLIVDRDILMLQVHAQSAADLPAIRDAVRAGIARSVRVARELTGAGEAAIQNFIAFGQLCHLVTTLGLDGLDTDWARIVSRGIRHFD